MKKLFITVILLIFTACLKAQTSTPEAPPDLDKITIEENVDSSKTIAAERIPEFPGGLEKFMSYVTQNFRMPRSSHNAGKVIVAFIIEKDGSVTNVKVSRGLSSDIDHEAIRVVSRSPKWLPGIQNGKAVRVGYSIPITIN